MKTKMYPYKGKSYTFKELCDLFPHMKPSILQGRLHKGMTVAEAIAPQTYEEWIPEKFRDQDLVVCFDVTPAVIPSMQPALKKQYLAKPHNTKSTDKAFYTINVRGNKLIVYPGEFRILGIAKPINAQADKTQCVTCAAAQ